MKFIVQVSLVCLISGASFCRLAPVSLDGTTGTSIYEASNYTFANGDSALGFVRLNGGFTVPASSVVTLNLLTPVAGAINLHGNSQITLAGDLSLASNATLASGGILDGQGYSIFLNSDLATPASQTIEFVSNTVIDGQGHELFLTPGAVQFYINGAPGTTVTLRNMTLRGLQGFGITFGPNANQTLVLENVEIHLAGDYIFTGGNLSINGFVSINGWNTFEYAASNDCTIQQDSTLFIDMRTTFLYNPGDISRTHLVMIDRTSRLFLNGCTFYVPPSVGLLLTNGHLVVDHNTTFFGNGALNANQGIAFGNGHSNRDLNVDIMPAANIDLSTAFLTYANQT